MATITADDVITRFPQFDGMEDQIDLIIPELGFFISDQWPDDIARTASLYLVAHFLTVEQSGGGSEQVSSESFGPISVSYKTSESADTLFGGTMFGLRFLFYRKNVFGGPVVV